MPVVNIGYGMKPVYESYTEDTRSNKKRGE